MHIVCTIRYDFSFNFVSSVQVMIYVCPITIENSQLMYKISIDSYIK